MISYFVYYCYGASRTPKRGTLRCVSDTLWFLSFSRDSFNKHLWNFSLLLPESTKLLSGMFRENAEGVLNFYDALAQLLSLKIWKGIDFERPFTIASFPRVTSAICWRHAKLQLEPLKFRKPLRPSQENPDLVNGWKIKSSKQASDKDTKQQSRICCQWRFHHRLECYLVLSLLIIWLRSRCVVCVLAVCDYISSRVERVFLELFSNLHFSLLIIHHNRFGVSPCFQLFLRRHVHFPLLLSLFQIYQWGYVMFASWSPSL